MSLALLPRFFEEEFSKVATYNVGIYEDENAFIVKAPLPGIKREEIEVSLKDHLLTIEGETVEEKGPHIHRPLANRYAYQVTLSEKVDENGSIEAQLENGILTVKLPKSRVAKPLKIVVK